ncbi:MAG: RNA polymerase factor sigma-54, partial [Muribaculaceae bacterium]|nr:RNA polymerase factor sigma-54 [Muribaculaceae bacterium]
YFANNRSTDDEYHGPTAVSEKTMQEVLLDQLREMELDETQQIIAQTIVGNIEDNGYLRRSAAEIADDVTFNDGYYVNADQVEEMIGVVQTLDPAGIAARDVRECILLQLQRKPQSEQVKIATTIIDKYFDELAAMRLDTIARRMDLDKGVVENVVKNHIRRGINPYPGNAFSSRADAVQQVTPDFDVELDEDSGRLTVTLRNNIPALQISESFALMNERYKRAGSELSVKEAKEKKQIQDAYQRASIFIEVLKQRQETLFNTMNAIVKCQRDYFLSGDERDLKPLGQQQIADMIGKDVSVVSRAVNNKYVQLPWGVKSLKSFFSEGINGAPRHVVYDDLKKLVDGEDKAHPLSDDALCERLKAMGYQLERRTVAKYRDQLGIPSSTIRRKMAR